MLLSFAFNTFLIVNHEGHHQVIVKPSVQYWLASVFNCAAANNLGLSTFSEGDVTSFGISLLNELKVIVFM